MTFRCNCGVERSRKMTAEEKRRFMTEMFPKSSNSVSRVYLSFVKAFMKEEEWEWKWIGYDLMKRVEKWAKKYPSEVHIVGVDDDVFASSVLVLIEARTHDSYMGTSVIYIPQCTGEKPIRFFLYPCHRAGLITALKEIAKEEVPRRKREKVVERERTKWWNSRVKVGFDNKVKYNG